MGKLRHGTRRREKSHSVPAAVSYSTGLRGLSVVSATEAPGGPQTHGIQTPRREEPGPVPSNAPRARRRGVNGVSSEISHDKTKRRDSFSIKPPVCQHTTSGSASRTPKPPGSPVASGWVRQRRRLPSLDTTDIPEAGRCPGTGRWQVRFPGRTHTRVSGLIPGRGASGRLMSLFPFPSLKIKTRFLG